MRLKWLEVSNHVRIWNKVKNFIFVESKLELCQLEMLIFIHKLICQSSLINLFHFSSLNLIVYREEKRKKYFSRMYIFSNPQIEILVSFSRSTNVNVNMYFPNSNFEGNLCDMQVFWHYRDQKIECWISRHILCKKILNFFIWVDVTILCKKVKYVWSSHFPETITNKHAAWKRLLLCLNIRLRVNKKFQNSH